MLDGIRRLIERDEAYLAALISGGCRVAKGETIEGAVDCTEERIAELRASIAANRLTLDLGEAAGLG